MGILSKEQLLSAQKRPTLEVEIPELGGTLRMRAPSAAGALRIRALQKRAQKDDAAEAELMAAIVEASCIDSEGKPLLTQDEARGVLDTVSVEALTVILNKFGELSGAKGEAEPGNSEPSPSAG